MMKTLACYSIKGGVGKTVAAVNLSYIAATKGLKTLLCDLDPQGAATFYFRINPDKALNAKTYFDKKSSVFHYIKGSDFDNLDVLPSKFSFRNFDVILSEKKKSNWRLSILLSELHHEYDLVVLDCPSNINLLSENVFNAADIIIVPVIPTTLSERTFEQLLHFFTKEDYQNKKLYSFFSMAQKQKQLHIHAMERLRETYSQFLKTVIPFSADIEYMGQYRNPVTVYAPKKNGSKAFHALWDEIESLIR
jgi:chromosome partitioning protein